MPEPYATRMNADGTRTYYRNRRDYQAGRGQARATAAATRARINRRVGGRVV